MTDVVASLRAWPWPFTTDRSRLLIRCSGAVLGSAGCVPNQPRPLRAFQSFCRTALPLTRIQGLAGLCHMLQGFVYQASDDHPVLACHNARGSGPLLGGRVLIALP